MNIEKILSISGKPGLFALKVQTRSGFVAESLIDGKKITVGMKSNGCFKSHCHQRKRRRYNFSQRRQ
jgi:hypothetical protein